VFFLFASDLFNRWEEIDGVLEILSSRTLVNLMVLF